MCSVVRNMVVAGIRGDVTQIVGETVEMVKGPRCVDSLVVRVGVGVAWRPGLGMRWSRPGWWVAVGVRILGHVQLSFEIKYNQHQKLPALGIWDGEEIACYSPWSTFSNHPRVKLLGIPMHCIRIKIVDVISLYNVHTPLGQ